MIDLHSHILAGIDDGARRIEDSLALAHNCVENGVTHLMCTPHIHLGVFDNTADTIEIAFNNTLKALHQENIPLKLAMGSEVRITPEVLDWVTNQQLPFIGRWQGRAALLLELPHSHIPPGLENVIRWLLARNVQTVIPHPERNREILSNYSKAKWLKQLGCLFQATAGAYVGRFSDKVEQTVWAMQTDGLIDYVASDMHNIKNRPNDMRSAFNAIAERIDTTTAKKLCIDVPSEITAGVNWQ